MDLSKEKSHMKVIWRREAFLSLGLVCLIRSHPSGFTAVKCKQQLRRKFQVEADVELGV